MAILRAFRALRPVPEKAAKVAALPYDVVNREEARAIGEANPDSFLHVDRAEMDLPPDVDLYDPSVYQKAKEKVHIEFRKVKGHSNDKYNDMVDELAKEALGIH